MKTSFLKKRCDAERQPLLPLFQEMEVKAETDWKQNLKKIENPCNDKDRLWNAQVDWIKYGDRRAYAVIWDIGLKVAGKQVSIMCRQRKLHMTADEKQDVAVEAMARIMERYEKYERYEIQNFITQIIKAVIQVMDTQTKADMLLKNLYGVQGTCIDSIEEIMASIKKGMT